MSNPEYAKMVNARAREKAEREALKRAQKEAKRAGRRGLFGKKKAEPVTAPPQTEKPAAESQTEKPEANAPENADKGKADVSVENKGEGGGQSD